MVKSLPTTSPVLPGLVTAQEINADWVAFAGVTLKHFLIFIYLFFFFDHFLGLDTLGYASQSGSYL